jgi:hypothetical protein
VQHHFRYDSWTKGDNSIASAYCLRVTAGSVGFLARWGNSMRALAIMRQPKKGPLTTTDKSVAQQLWPSQGASRQNLALWHSMVEVGLIHPRFLETNTQRWALSKAMISR